MPRLAIDLESAMKLPRDLRGRLDPMSLPALGYFIPYSLQAEVRRILDAVEPTE